jgi:rhamnosyl/mannosyltransferase
METHVRSLAQAQTARGLEVGVACVNHASPNHGMLSRPPEERDGTVRVWRFGRCGSVAKLDFCPGLLALARHWRHWRPDVLHLHTPNPTMLLTLAALRPAIPLVITHHSDVVRQRWLALAMRPFEHQVYSRARRILTGSAAYRDGSAVLRRYAPKVTVVPFGLDLAPYLGPSPAIRRRAERWRAEHGGPLWLAVGRLVYYKGFETAVDALALVPGTLLVIGTGPLERTLRQRAERRGVADRITWHGHATADELVGAYHAATALWFPSNARSEGFGLVQVEALASGCPVINTALAGSGVPWVSPHDQTGLTVPINDPPALAAAALRLLQEPGLRERLALGARERARQEFDHRLMAERTAAVYAEAVTEA